MSKKMNIAAGVASLALIGGAAFGFVGISNLRENQPVKKVDASKVYTAEGIQNPASGDAQADKVQRDAEAARIAAEQEAARQAEAARVAAEQAARAQAQRQASQRQVTTTRQVAQAPSSPAPTGLPSGSVVPQPNGYPDTTLCASGSASTVNGVPTCD